MSVCLGLRSPKYLGERLSITWSPPTNCASHEVAIKPPYVAPQVRSREYASGHLGEDAGSDIAWGYTMIFLRAADTRYWPCA